MRLLLQLASAWAAAAVYVELNGPFGMRTKQFSTRLAPNLKVAKMQVR